jgi:hypothetical protein
LKTASTNLNIPPPAALNFPALPTITVALMVDEEILPTHDLWNPAITSNWKDEISQYVESCIDYDLYNIDFKVKYVQSFEREEVHQGDQIYLTGSGRVEVVEYGPMQGMLFEAMNDYTGSDPQGGLTGWDIDDHTNNNYDIMICWIKIYPILPPYDISNGDFGHNHGKYGAIAVSYDWAHDDFIMELVGDTFSKPTFGDKYLFTHEIGHLLQSFAHDENGDVASDKFTEFNEYDYYEPYSVMDYDDADYMTEHDSDVTWDSYSFNRIISNKDQYLHNDPDNDGLDNLEEHIEGTHPYAKDSDNDGLDDYEEIYTYYTDPTNWDHDSDDMPDGWEVQYGFDPKIPNGYADPDNDGLVNFREFQFTTNPLDADTDNDNLNDYTEIYSTLTDPNKWDTDGDNMHDGWEASYYPDLLPTISDAHADPDDDWLDNYEEYQQGTDPTDPDSDNDGILDGDEVFIWNTEPMNWDSDGDEMSDGWEISYYPTLNPTQFDANVDSDVDNYTNLEEYFLGSNPTIKNAIVSSGSLFLYSSTSVRTIMHFDVNFAYTYQIKIEYKINGGSWVTDRYYTAFFSVGSHYRDEYLYARPSYGHTVYVRWTILNGAAEVVDQYQDSLYIPPNYPGGKLP